jgi:hypothetical protein
MNRNDDDKFIGQVTRSADLYRQGLITAKEFTDVTINDLHHLRDQRPRQRETFVVLGLRPLLPVR